MNSQLISRKKLRIILQSVNVFIFLALARTLIFAGDQTLNDSIQGFWISSNPGGNPEMLFVNKSVIHALIQGEIYEHPLRIDNNKIILLDRRTDKGIGFKLSHDILVLEWDNGTKTKYIKSSANNSLAESLINRNLQIDLPVLHHYSILKNNTNYITISLLYNQNGEVEYYIDTVKTNLLNITDEVIKRKMSKNQLTRSSFGINFQIDVNINMTDVINLRKELAWATLNYAYSGYANDEDKISPLLADRLALIIKMPPPDKPEFNNSIYSNAGYNIVKINVQDIGNSKELKKYKNIIKNKIESGQYIILVEYESASCFEDYINTISFLHNCIYELRNDFSISSTSIPYKLLGKTFQKEIDLVYPLSIIERMSR